MILIVPKAAAIILQVSENTARKKLKAIKEYYGLKPHQEVSIVKFCEYFALEEDRVVKRLKELGWD